MGNVNKCVCFPSCSAVQGGLEAGTEHGGGDIFDLNVIVKTLEFYSNITR